MLLLLPCGATLPAVAAILGGNPVLGLSGTTITSLLAPFAIPFAFAVFSGTDIDIDIMGMFYTLAAIVFLPVGLYGLVKRYGPRRVTGIIQANTSFYSIVTICVVIITIVAAQRDFFLSDLGFLVEASVLGTVVYAAMYLGGWFLAYKMARRERIAMALMCGVNNTAIGISLAFLYFPPRETLMLLLWEISWLLGLAVFQFYLSRCKD
jgi:BASS family bile acid:Na+ symporter